MGKPLVVVLAEIQRCPQEGCDGKLEWRGLQTLSSPPQYSLHCLECGCIHLFRQGEGAAKVECVDSCGPFK